MAVKLMERLIIFTRYPIPGKTKTRMIPSLGYEGALTLHHEMTNHTLKISQQWLNDYPNSNQNPKYLAIYYHGGNQELMQLWLGKDHEYHQQSTGDLGEKMLSAIQESQQQNYQKIVIIGTDCPSLTPPLINQAFQQLNHKEIVLGPAQDGGYYLIGVKDTYPPLFKNIPWGTSRVFQDTINQIKQLQLSFSLLPILTDIDYPDDLWIWEEIKNHL